ncbi:MAG TPA: type 2 lanthipeptide synthetase LanM family protein [Candidatus Angelobacter sp.]
METKQADEASTTSWLSALTLAERTAVLRSLNGAPACFDAAQAAKHLRQWRAQAPFQHEESFVQRLRTDQLTPEEFERVLSLVPQKIEGVVGGHAEWIQALDSLYARPKHPDTSEEESEEQMGRRGFLFLAEPIAQHFLSQFRRHLSALHLRYSTVPFEDQIFEAQLLASLNLSLLRILIRTAVLELNVARVQGLLAGETPDQRFISYLRHLRRPGGRLTFFQEYPVLARALRTCAANWLRFSRELSEHLCADCDLVSRTFQHDFSRDRVSHVHIGSGDTHRQGRSVTIFKFISGRQLVYKPRSLSCDVHFNELLAWCNDKGISVPFRCTTNLDCHAYGWTEYIAAAECGSEAQVRRFYHSLGASLALLHALNAADFHYENLIAAGEYPVLIDLEALFHAPARQIEHVPALDFVYRAIQRTVLRTGLLPHRIWVDKKTGVDLSGVGGASGQMTPDEVLARENDGTDEMRFVRKRLPMPGAKNRPSCLGQEVDPANYQEHLVAGFEEMYSLMVANRQELLSREGPLWSFANDEIRLVPRPTRTYAQVLTESYHPNVLRDALDRDRLLDRLWMGLDRKLAPEPLVPAEQEDLRCGDIPLFVTRPNSRHLWSSTGARIPNYIAKPVMQLVTRSIRGLSQQDLKRQVEIIRCSFATLKQPEGALKPLVLENSHPPSALPKELVRGAKKIGDLLVDSAFAGAQYATWIVVQPLGELWNVSTAPYQLYSGLPGIALFLAYLGELTGQRKYRVLAENALMTSLEIFQNNYDRSTSKKLDVGAFGGYSGLVYCLLHCAALWKEDALLQRALEITGLLLPNIDEDEVLDIVEGSAGLLCTLSALYKTTSSEQVRTAARKCADHLVAHAVEMPRGVAWKTPIAETPLTGFGHGAAGIAHALLSFAAVHPDGPYIRIAEQAFEYERSQQVAELGNWRDLRQPAGDSDHCAVAWCHGAPGIGLSRLAALPWINSRTLQAEIDMAVSTTVQNGLRQDNGLCHGNFGLLGFLFEAALRQKKPDLQEHVCRASRLLIQAADKRGWLCSTPGSVDTPGLMLGLAGIGLALLRFAAPERVPSVLLLESESGSVPATVVS